MDLINHDKYSIITCDNLTSFNSLINFLHKNSLNYQHIIINCLNSNVKDSVIVKSLLPFYLSWEKRNKSFILVSNIRNKSLKGLISIKTLEEAIDFFYMEELTRSI